VNPTASTHALRRRVARRALACLAVGGASAGGVAAQGTPPSPSSARAQPLAERLAQQVEVRRTAYGVPHIQAANLKAAAYALAYVQLEDHGPGVAYGLLRARGEMGRWFGRDSMGGDFQAQRAYAIAVARYAQLDVETRDVYEGFAAGVNQYVARRPQEFPAGFAPRFTAYDVAARDVNIATPDDARRFLARLAPPDPRRGATAAREPAEGDVDSAPGVDRVEEGSNAWAFAPSRTKSGRAILVRNPHLAWTAGYYEAHVTVPGVLDFYGDFRVGGRSASSGASTRTWAGRPPTTRPTSTRSTRSTWTRRARTTTCSTAHRYRWRASWSRSPTATATGSRPRRASSGAPRSAPCSTATAARRTCCAPRPRASGAPASSSCT
jgi:hypothetical protein